MEVVVPAEPGREGPGVELRAPRPATPPSPPGPTGLQAWGRSDALPSPARHAVPGARARLRATRPRERSVALPPPGKPRARRAPLTAGGSPAARPPPPPPPAWLAPAPAPPRPTAAAQPSDAPWRRSAEDAGGLGWAGQGPPALCYRSLLRLLTRAPGLPARRFRTPVAARAPFRSASRLC